MSEFATDFVKESASVSFSHFIFAEKGVLSPVKMFGTEAIVRRVGGYEFHYVVADYGNVARRRLYMVIDHEKPTHGEILQALRVFENLWQDWNLGEVWFCLPNGTHPAYPAMMTE